MRRMRCGAASMASRMPLKLGRVFATSSMHNVLVLVEGNAEIA
jgi:hypothetical protein